MKIPKNQEIPKIAIDHSSDIDFENFMELYRKCNAKTFLSLLIGTTLPSYNPLRFGRIYKNI